MPETFIALPLTADQVDQAWPLVQSVYPEITLERWRDYAGPLAAGLLVMDMKGVISIANHPSGRGPILIADRLNEKGLIALQSKGYIHGIFHYQVTDSLTHGRTLQVDDIALLTPFSRKAAEQALCAAISEAANHLRCQATHTVVPETRPRHNRHAGALVAEGELLGLLQAAGHLTEGVLLCRDVVPDVMASTV